MLVGYDYNKMRGGAAITEVSLEIPAANVTQFFKGHDDSSQLEVDLLNKFYSGKKQKNCNVK